MPRSTNVTPDRIAQRAFELWQRDGCPEGKSMEHWLAAERELNSGKTSAPMPSQIRPDIPPTRIPPPQRENRRTATRASERLLARLPIIV